MSPRQYRRRSYSLAAFVCLGALLASCSADEPEVDAQTTGTLLATPTLGEDALSDVTEPPPSSSSPDDGLTVPQLLLVRRGGEEALGQGTLSLNGGCPLLAVGTAAHLIIWPQGTVVDGSTLLVAGDPAERLDDGAEVSLGGGFDSLSTLTQSFSGDEYVIPERCQASADAADLFVVTLGVSQ